MAAVGCGLRALLFWYTLKLELLLKQKFFKANLTIQKPAYKPVIAYLAKKITAAGW